MGHSGHVSSWLVKSVALLVVLTAAFITIHPDFDLLDGVLHNGHDHDRILHAPMVAATTEHQNELLITRQRLLDSHSQRDEGSLVSLDLLCVRLC
jgi:hypothetical protein